MLKTESEVWGLVGKDSVLEFRFLSDKIATFETVTPCRDLETGGFVTYKVELFLDDEGHTFFRHDSFNDFLDGFQIFTLRKVCQQTFKHEDMYISTYKGNK